MMETAVVVVILAVYAGTLWVVRLREQAGDGQAPGLEAITRREIDAEVSALQRRYHPSRRSVWLGRLALLALIAVSVMPVFISQLP